MEKNLENWTTEEILTEMEACEERADLLHEELVARVKGESETDLSHLSTDALLDQSTEAQQKWIELQEVIIERAKERDVLLADLKSLIAHFL
jgi:hypothetical protein